MSLVSSLSSAITWNDRASELEYRYSLLTDKINSLMDKSADLGEAISRIDNKLSMNQNRIMFLRSQMSSESDPAKKAKLANLLNTFIAETQKGPMAKLSLQMQQNQLDKQERQLQKEKQEIEVQKKFAQATAQGLEKMQDAAIQRLTIKG